MPCRSATGSSLWPTQVDLHVLIGQCIPAFASNCTMHCMLAAGLSHTLRLRRTQASGSYIKQAQARPDDGAEPQHTELATAKHHKPNHAGGDAAAESTSLLNISWFNARCMLPMTAQGAVYEAVPFKCHNSSNQSGAQDGWPQSSSTVP